MVTQTSKGSIIALSSKPLVAVISATVFHPHPHPNSQPPPFSRLTHTAIQRRGGCGGCGLPGLPPRMGRVIGPWPGPPGRGRGFGTDLPHVQGLFLHTPQSPLGSSLKRGIVWLRLVDAVCCRLECCGRKMLFQTPKSRGIVIGFRGRMLVCSWDRSRLVLVR